MMIPIKVWPFKCIDKVILHVHLPSNPNPFQFYYLGSLIFQALWQSLAPSCLYQKDARGKYCFESWNHIDFVVATVVIQCMQDLVKFSVYVC